MIRAIRACLARRAYVRAQAAYSAYQTQPAGGAWHIALACALADRRDIAAARYAALIAGA